MAKPTRAKDSSQTTDTESSYNTSTTTSESSEQTVYCVISEETGIQYLPISEARNIIEKQQHQIFGFTSRLREMEINSDLIKDYFGKSVDINKQLLDRYRKLLDWIFKGGVSILLLSILLIALPLILFLYKFGSVTSFDVLKTIMWWIVGLYGAINIGGLFTWGLATFGFKKQFDNLEKRTDRLEDHVFKK